MAIYDVNGTFEKKIFPITGISESTWNIDFFNTVLNKICLSFTKDFLNRNTVKPSAKKLIATPLTT